MTNPSRWLRYNERKLQTLSIFASQGSAISVRSFAILSGMRPVRCVYSYLGRLARWRLLRRGKSPSGRIVFQISERGRERLAWLRLRT